jgi:hypothetical protein
MSNNHSSIDATVEPASADVDIGVTTPEDKVHNGDTVHYRFLVGNHGPDPADDVIAKVTFNRIVSVKSLSTTVGECTVVKNRDLVRCDLGRIVKGHNVRGNLDVRMQSAGRLVATAEVHSDTPDPDHANNDDQVTVHVEPVADMKVMFLEGREPPNKVGVDKDFSFSITVSNAPDSPDSAHDVKAFVYVIGPARVTPSTSSMQDCDKVAGAPDLLCKRGVLGPSGSIDYGFEVEPTDTGTVTIRVRVRGADYDPDTDNNTRSRDVTITK